MEIVQKFWGNLHIPVTRRQTKHLLERNPDFIVSCTEIYLTFAQIFIWHLHRNTSKTGIQKHPDIAFICRDYNWRNLTPPAQVGFPKMRKKEEEEGISFKKLCILVIQGDAIST